MTFCCFCNILKEILGKEIQTLITLFFFSRYSQPLYSIYYKPKSFLQFSNIFDFVRKYDIFCASTYSHARHVPNYLVGDI